MYGRIMIPLDGSELAQTVLSEAINLARALEATLVLLVRVLDVAAEQSSRPASRLPRCTSECLA